MIHHIQKFETLDSTNNYAKEHLESLADRSVIVADIQTAGRGRNQTKWLSHIPNNLYISIVLKPFQKLTPESHIEKISLEMADAIVQILNQFDVKAEIKLPNDILVDGKKIAGMLTETEVQGKTLKGVILGVGVNLNMTQSELDQIDQPATALNLLVKKETDHQQFLKDLLTHFFKNYEVLLKR